MLAIKFIFKVLGSRVLPLCGASSYLAWLSSFLLFDLATKNSYTH